MFGSTFVPSDTSAGSWVPNISNTANVATAFSSPGGFIRIGNIVIFWGTFTISATVAGQCTFDFSPPILSNFSAITDAAGQAGATRTGIATQDLGTIFATVGTPGSLHMIVNADAAATNINFRYIGGYIIR